MAQTKRKRQTKHRGNAAGVIEARGRTGRKPTAGEKSGDVRQLAREKEGKLDRRDRPPTWKSAFLKGMLAAIGFLVIFALLLRHTSQGISFFPIALVFYTPISYYTDKWVYDRRQRSKAKQAPGRGTASR
jgi:hypothetical protein